MNSKWFYRPIKLYKRRSSGIRSPSTPNLVVPPTGHTPGDQPILPFSRIFYWTFGVASISHCVNSRFDMEPLAKELVLDNDRDAHVMSYGVENEQTFITKTMKGTTFGLVPGILWGLLAAEQMNFPGLIPTLKLTGRKGLICAGTGGLWVGMKQLLEKYRMKRDIINDVGGAFVAGAAFSGLRNMSIAMAITGGITFAITAVFIDNVLLPANLGSRSGK